MNDMGYLRPSLHPLEWGMVRLIVSEKPSMGRAIAAALGIQGTGRSSIQGQGVIVTWCVGHLVEALAPEGYDPALKQ